MPKTAEGRQTKLAKPASAYSSQPKIAPAVLQKVLQKQGPSVGYPRIGGPDSHGIDFGVVSSPIIKSGALKDGQKGSSSGYCRNSLV